MDGVVRSRSCARSEPLGAQSSRRLGHLSAPSGGCGRLGSVSAGLAMVPFGLTSLRTPIDRLLLRCGEGHDQVTVLPEPLVGGDFPTVPPGPIRS